MAVPQARFRQPRQMDAGVLADEIASFRLHLAAGGKAPKTIRLYSEAVTWFAAAMLLGQAGKTGWEQAEARDVQEWMAWLLSKVQPRLRQQPVPGAAAVLQVARRRGRGP